MTIAKHHLVWFKLKHPYAIDSKEYKAAHSKLNNASYKDLEKLRAEFELYEDESGLSVVTYYDPYSGKYLCRIHPDAPTKFKNEYGSQRYGQVSMKGIQVHRSSFRVRKRVGDQLHVWSYDNLPDAVNKRDAIFAKYAA